MRFSKYALITLYVTGDSEQLVLYIIKHSKPRHIHTFRPYHSIYSDTNLPFHMRCFAYIYVNIPISLHNSIYWQHNLLLRLYPTLISKHSLHWFLSTDKTVPLRQQFFIFNLFFRSRRVVCFFF